MRTRRGSVILSTAKTLCSLIVDSPAPGDWNMALDEALLDSADEEKRPSVRFYQWRDPTVSLGYFQHHADRASHAASSRCELVRRSTGGGAIVHDIELTYSIAWPHVHPETSRPGALVDSVHEALIAALGSLGVAARKCTEASCTPPSGEPFLCFQRRSCQDVMIGPSKVAGSAQRRRRRAILQHGSLLLGRSDAAPELDGIRELTGRQLGVAELIRAWSSEIADQLAIEWVPSQPTRDQARRADVLLVKKYGCAKWTERR